MTNQSMFARRGLALPSVPKGDVLGTYDTYLEAQSVVDRLSKADFEVAKLSIVGNDLKTVERVTGKQTYGKAALAGAASGAWLGLFLGLVFTLFTPPSAQTFGIVGAALLIGAGFGMIFSIVTYTIGRRRRDFTSTHQVLASNYQIIIDPELTAKAQQALLSHPAE
ncbi:general stress protein [Salinibacterium sp.]|uniref:general stress protein n=1 Tax=Salinibacterium sp. TaxID=1915057 RepID=UPI00286B628F|nr:general stress protein [Salinibacterium sp.]